MADKSNWKQVSPVSHSSVDWLPHFGSGFMLLCCLCRATGRDLTSSIRNCLYGCFISKITQIPMNLLKQCLNRYLPYAGYQTSHGWLFFFGITCNVHNKGYTETDTTYSLQILLSAYSHYFSAEIGYMSDGCTGYVRRKRWQCGTCTVQSSEIN